MRPIHTWRLTWHGSAAKTAKTAKTLAATACVLTGCESVLGDCTEQRGMWICGVFGVPVQDVAAPALHWPGVAMPDGGLRVHSAGRLIDIQAELMNPVDPSDMATGIVASGLGTATVDTASAEGGGTRVRSRDETGFLWERTLVGRVSFRAPTIGAARVYVAVDRAWATHTITLDRNNGATLVDTPDRTPPMIVPNGERRALEHRGECGIYSDLVASDPADNLLWRHAAADGIMALSIDVRGNGYLLDSDRRIQKVSAAGIALWRLPLPSSRLPGMAAPAVDGNAVFVSTAAWAYWHCEDDRWFATGTTVQSLQAIDVLSGKQRWRYEGTSLPTAAIQPANPRQLRLRGQPALAADGTVYVPVTGGVVALSNDAEYIGAAIWDLGREPYTPYDEPSDIPTRTPILSADGTLHVYAHGRLRGFRVGKVPAPDSWIPPFGPGNAGVLR